MQTLVKRSIRRCTYIKFDSARDGETVENFYQEAFFNNLYSKKFGDKEGTIDIDVMRPSPPHDALRA